MQLMLGYRFFEPFDYVRFVIVIVEVVQVVRIQGSDSAQDFSEWGAFDSVHFAVGMLPKSFYRLHGCSFSLALRFFFFFELLTNKKRSVRPRLPTNAHTHAPIKRFSTDTPLS